MRWRAVDGGGRAAWPMTVVADDGRSLPVGEALGPGGRRVEALLQALAQPLSLPAGDVEALARASPVGRLDLPLAPLPLAAAAAAAASVDRAWLAAVDARRTALREAVVAAGRGTELEGALHVTMLAATERLDPEDDADVDAHVASGAQLWLLAGAVVSALAGADPDPFAPWGRLVAAGWWPVGPSGGRLVVGRPGR